MSDSPRVVVGGTPAALVAADALGRAGVPVRLRVPEKGVGRGFPPMPTSSGHKLQLGVRVLELAYEDDGSVPPLAEYEPGSSGHRPYAPLIRSWVEDLVGDRLRPVAAPRVALGGKLHDDYLFTVDLTGVAPALQENERRRVADEAAAAARELGDAGVLGAELGDTSLAEASLANHGRTFHDRLIEPLAAKFVPGGTAAILADWRRKAWMPLFWPRTVREAFAGEAPAFRPGRTFHDVAPGGVAGLVDALVERIRSHESVETVTVAPLAGVDTRGAETVVTFADGTSESAARPALGMATAELFAALDIEAEVERMRTVIAWIEVADDEYDGERNQLVHVVDAYNPVVRVSTGSSSPQPGHTVICVELRHDVEA